jgi:hypothetical protein
MQQIPVIAREGMSALRHFFIAMHPPRVVWTTVATPTLTKVASPAIAIKDKGGKDFATAGIVATDSDGRIGVTTALHSVDENGPEVWVAGVPGQIAAKDIFTDSCFITFTLTQLPGCSTCNGPLTDVTPGRNEQVWFDGIASGRTATYVDGWTLELPWIMPGVQSRVITPPITELGDSGAALMNQQGKVVGFALCRTGFASRTAFSAWIWAESVFSALHLQ